MFQWEGDYWWFVARRRLAQALLQAHLPEITGRMLDAGCGTGALLRELHAQGVAVGVDVEREALCLTRQRGALTVVQARLCEAGFQVRRLSYALGALLPLIALARWLDRLRPGAPAATVIPLPHWLNRALIRLQDWETRYLLRRRLPFGVSLVAVAQRE